MSFVQGKNLAKVMQVRKRFKEEIVVFYAAQIVAAVAFMHRNGVVHRDVTPENIVCGSDGFIRITDFSVAKRLEEESLYLTHSFCGLTEYLSPEMIARVGHSFSVDWWSLGIIMYEMLFGVTPFFHKNQSTLLNKIKSSKIVFPDRQKYKISYSDNI